MKVRARALIVAVVLALAVPLFAADVDGRWSGTVSTPGGDFPVTFVFKADGSKLTGTMLGMDGAEIPIADGKIDGSKISFNVTLDFGGMSLQILYNGVVSAEKIDLDGSVFDMPFQLVVTKQK